MPRLWRRSTLAVCYPSAKNLMPSRLSPGWRRYWLLQACSCFRATSDGPCNQPSLSLCFDFICFHKCVPACQGRNTTAIHKKRKTAAIRLNPLEKREVKIGREKNVSAANGFAFCDLSFVPTACSGCYTFTSGFILYLLSVFAQ